MRIKKLNLKDFRNYERLEIELHPRLNIFVGDNAQGKTNLLEAIYFLSTARSFRVNDEKVCIRQDQEFAICRVEGESTVPFQLKAVIHPLGKTLFYQNQLIKRSSEFIGKMNAVLFSPSDLELFEASRKARRRLIDLELGKINTVYMERLSYFLKLVKDRNVLLKQNLPDKLYFESITEEMIDVQLELIKMKQAFTDQINLYLSEYFKKLSLSELDLKLVYHGPVEINHQAEEQLKEKYEKSLERDKTFKQTHIGIHRDDFSFLLEGENVNHRASQGQKRMIMLALKCSLVAVIEALSSNKPVLLLDDVFSELDKKRRQALYEVLKDHTQTIITTTDLDDVSLWLDDDVWIYEVQAAQCERRS